MEVAYAVAESQVDTTPRRKINGVFNPLVDTNDQADDLVAPMHELVCEHHGCTMHYLLFARGFWGVYQCSAPRCQRTKTYKK